MLSSFAVVSSLILLTSVAHAASSSSGIDVSPEYVFIGSLQPGSAVCRVINTARLPYLWNGITWYTPDGAGISGNNNPQIIVDMVYHATQNDHWTSTLNIASADYTLNGNYTCEVNYNNVITRVQTTIAIQGCPLDSYTCKTSGGCVQCSLLCNGQNDCGDWSDEFHCNTASSPLLTDGNCVYT